MLDDRQIYILKQSNGFMRSFIYMDKAGIVERILRRGQWSKYNIIIKNAHRNFSVIMFPNDDISILYKDNRGNIYMTMYDDEEGNPHQIYSNDDENDVSFKAFCEDGKIHVFFTLTNKRIASKTILHQIIDKEYNISPLDIIGNVNFNYKTPFIVHSTPEGYLYVMYQRYKERHYLGYKVLNKKDNIWSKFHQVDESPDPFVDFTLCCNDDGLHAAYIKAESGTKKLVHFHEANGEASYANVGENDNISSCSLFKNNGMLWCLWIKNEMLFEAFTIKGDNDFSNPPFEEPIKIDNIERCKYISNYTEDGGEIQSLDMYVSNNGGPDYLSFPLVFNPNLRVKNEGNSPETYISLQIIRKLEASLEKINEKDKLIKRLEEEILHHGKQEP